MLYAPSAEPRERTEPGDVGVVWYDTLGAIHGAFADGWAEGEVTWGGETPDGEEAAFTLDQMLDGMRRQGMWGFECGGTIHLWAEPEKIATPDFAHLIAHEIAHATCGHDGTLDDEKEAERYGAVAAQTVRVLDMIGTVEQEGERIDLLAVALWLNGPIQLSEIAIVRAPRLEVIRYDEDGVVHLAAQEIHAADLTGEP